MRGELLRRARIEGPAPGSRAQPRRAGPRPAPELVPVVEVARRSDLLALGRKGPGTPRPPRGRPRRPPHPTDPGGASLPGRGTRSGSPPWSPSAVHRGSRSSRAWPSPRRPSNGYLRHYSAVRGTCQRGTRRMSIPDSCALGTNGHSKAPVPSPMRPLSRKISARLNPGADSADHPPRSAPGSPRCKPTPPRKTRAASQ